MKTHCILIFIALFGVYTTLNSQPAIKTIDNTGSGDFISFTAAINYLNTLSTLPDSGIVFNVVAGQVFQEDPPAITKVATSSKPVAFKKSGTGLNPIIKNDNSPVDDGVIQFSSAAFISFDAIDITDINNSDANQYNTAYYINNSANITIKNCNITNFSVYGIYIRNASVNILIDKNNLYYTPDFSTNQASVFAIYANYNSTANNIVITCNKVWGIKTVTSTLYGIRINQVSGTIANNFVSLSNDGNDKTYGIRVDNRDGKTINVLHNSVCLSGTATDDGFALSVQGAAGSVKIRNNIFINTRDTAQTEQLAIHVGFDGLTFNMDYNLYYSNEDLFGRWYQTYCSNIDSWMNVSGIDLHSALYNVQFINPANGNLHISDYDAGHFILAGTFLPDYPADIDNDMRDTVFPYKGADEHAVSLNLHASISADSVGFGENTINTVSDSVVLLIHNQGNNAFDIDSVVTTNGFVMKINNSTYTSFIGPFVINSQTSVPVKLYFFPHSIGFFNGKIKIYMHNGQVLQAKLTGTSVPPGIKIIPDTIYFEPTAIVETSPAKQVIIKNTGSEPLVINAITFTSNNFEIRHVGSSNWLNQLQQFTIAVSDSVLIEVRFKPSQVMYYNQKMIVSISIDIEVPVYGYGIGTRFELLEGSFIGAWYGKTSLGDYDNDKDLDILITGYGLSAGQGYAYLYRNNGNMSFSLVPNTGIIGVGNGNADWIDIDGDGDLDIFTSGQMSYQNNTAQDTALFYRNDNGSFTRIPASVRPLSSASSDWADIDLDGDYDLVVMGQINAYVRFCTVYKNLGNFNFAVVQELPAAELGCVRFGDYDNDGYPDIALTGSRSSGNYITEIYHNQAGQFQKISQNFTGLRYSSLEWGDMDQDGDLDLVVTGSVQNEIPSLTKLFSNNGNGTFTEINHTLAGIRQGDLKLADFDQDGDPDIVMNGIYITDASWIGYIYLNNGSWNFTLADSITSLKYANMAIGDLDNDRDVDIFITGRYDYQNYWSKIYKNNWPVPNPVFQAPEGLTATVSGYGATFQWDNPGNEYTVNLRIGTTPEGNEIINGMSHNDGYRKIAQKGNMQAKTQITIPYFPDNHYYISLQTIDNSFIGSAWCAPFEITIDANTPPLITGQIPDTAVNAYEQLVFNLNNIFNEQDPYDFLKFILTNTETQNEINFYSILADSLLIIEPDSADQGNYSLKLSAIDRSGDAAEINFNLTVKIPAGINCKPASLVSIFPNPAQSVLMITGAYPVKFSIISPDGNICIRGNLTESLTTQIDVSSLTNGIYFIIITTNNKSIIYKNKFVILK